MFEYKNAKIREFLLDGEFGIEKESLRINKDGSFAQSKHPFIDNKNIVRDFCENQLEINTGVSNSAKEAVDELNSFERQVRNKLKDLGEYLWPFSNPPYIKSEEDVPIAKFEGIMSEKTEYRNYLSKVYGKYKMTFSGIHVNYSFSEELLQENFKLSPEKIFKEYKNKLYLNLAKNYVTNGWLVTTLLASSPLLDSSFLNKGKTGQTDFIGMASVRCSELGYWNHFVPIIRYDSLPEYTASIWNMIDEGLLASQTELYYPVRLKPAGTNSLEALEKNGVNHIELRNIDVNPYAYAGMEVRDLEFIQLLLVYDACIDSERLTKDMQVRASLNFKNAAHYDIDTTCIMLNNKEIISVRKAAINLLNQIESFYKDINIDVSSTISYQKEKLLDSGKRYAEKVMNDFSGHFVEKGLEFLMKEKR